MKRTCMGQLYEYEINSIEKIQLEAAMIATGTTRPVSVELLYKETGWEPLRNRQAQNVSVLRND